MSNPNQLSPKSEKNTPRKLLARLGRAASKDQVKNHKTAEINPALSTEGVARVANALWNRPADNPRSLGKGKHYDLFRDAVGRSPLLTRDLKDGRQELLSHLMFVGESVLSVNTVIKHDGGVDEISIGVLPIGKQAIDAGGNRNLSSRTLLRLSPDAALRPGPDGVVQRWKELPLTRKHVERAFGIEDTQISNEHGKLGLDASGRFDIADTSSNGTEVLSINDLTQLGDATLPVAGAEDLLRGLQKEPYLWSNEFADKQVVLP